MYPHIMVEMTDRIEGQREQYFRSALELIKLIDDAVEKEQEMEGGNDVE